MKLEHAATLKNELSLLTEVVGDMANLTPKVTYADWLENQGDALRANFMRQLIEAQRQLDPDLVPQDDNVPDVWTGMIGAPMLHAILKEGRSFDPAQLKELVDQILSFVKPTLSVKYDYRGEPDLIYDPAIGGTHLFGNPDLPANSSWPTFSDCLHFHSGELSIPKNDPCRFVGQLNLADIADTVVSKQLPSSGLLSFFSNIDTEEYGTFSVYAKFTSMPTDLVRMSPPEPIRLDNEPVAAREPTLTERLSLPDATDGSPWKERLRIGEFGDAGKRILEKALRFSSDSLSFFGYLHGTTGRDPSPDCDHLKLASVRVSVDAGVAHLAIPSKDLKQCRLDDIKYVNMDWDS